MPRTIDSLSPKQDSAQSKPGSGPGAGDVYQPEGAAPVAGSVVKPEGHVETVEKPLKANSYRTDKAQSKQRKRAARRPFVRAFLKFGLPLILIVLLVGGYYYTTRKSTVINGETKENLADAPTKQKAKDAFYESPGIASLADSEKDELFKDLGPSFMAAYVTGLAPSQRELNLLQFGLGSEPTKAAVQQAMEDLIKTKLEAAKTNGYYEGTAFYVWYGDSVTNKLSGAAIDLNVVAQDKTYAEAKAREYRDKVVNGTMSDEEVLAALEADDKINFPDEVNGSGVFSTDSVESGYQDDGRRQSMQDYLKRQNSVGVTEIGVISGDPGIPASGKQREIGLVFVRLTKLLRGQAVIDYYERQLLVARGL